MTNSLTTLLPTTLVGSYPQPEWLIDRQKLAGRFPPRIRAQELWRIPAAFLAEAQDDATLLAIEAQESAGLDIETRENRSRRAGSETMKPIMTIAIVLAVFGIGAASAWADEAADALKKARTEEANRQVVVKMYNLLMNDHKVDEALEYIDPTYKQHNVRAPDGKEFLRGAFKARFAENPKFRSDIKRTVADGDLVVVHTNERYNPDDPNDLGNIIMDIYRVKNGLIVEHWDAYMPVPPKGQWLHANGSF